MCSYTAPKALSLEIIIVFCSNSVSFTGVCMDFWVGLYQDTFFLSWPWMVALFFQLLRSPTNIWIHLISVLYPLCGKNVVFKINGSKMKTAVSLSLEAGGKMGSGGGLTQLFMLRTLKHPIGRCWFWYHA